MSQANNKLPAWKRNSNPFNGLEESGNVYDQYRKEFSHLMNLGIGRVDSSLLDNGKRFGLTAFGSGGQLPGVNYDYTLDGEQVFENIAGVLFDRASDQANILHPSTFFSDIATLVNSYRALYNKMFLYEFVTHMLVRQDDTDRTANLNYLLANSMVIGSDMNTNTSTGTNQTKTDSTTNGTSSNDTTTHSTTNNKNDSQTTNNNKTTTDTDNTTTSNINQDVNTSANNSTDTETPEIVDSVDYGTQNTTETRNTDNTTIGSQRHSGKNVTTIEANGTGEENTTNVYDNTAKKTDGIDYSGATRSEVESNPQAGNLTSSTRTTKVNPQTTTETPGDVTDTTNDIKETGTVSNQTDKHTDTTTHGKRSTTQTDKVSEDVKTTAKNSQATTGNTTAATTGDTKTNGTATSETNGSVNVTGKNNSTNTATTNGTSSTQTDGQSDNSTYNYTKQFIELMDDFAKRRESPYSKFVDLMFKEGILGW